ncbi:hypothetical protein [Paenibacillus sp. IHBB 10380]|uniref:hypothetical protein n=1 Tax=Paenibacillus sp. IHBB 10380 TaxID=1566358 RepID=UPI0005CFC1EF|nr:hypothetical protein [Paenibacillus sp. IHBB 10380]AJS60003.1 hypothetical protein UB51_17720 [Paenibacillus sp. IHBB 10380]
MKKFPLFSFSLLVACSVALGGCGTETTPVSTSNVSQKELNYKIVVDEKFKNTEQREIRVTTEETDFEGITQEIQSKYKDQSLDSLHLYIHAPDVKDNFGVLKAHSFIAYTQKGAVQAGLTEKDSYKVEVEADVSTDTSTTNNKDDQTSKEWQDSFKEIAVSQAGTYVELTEKKGALPADRIEEYSKVVIQQANKIVDSSVKDELTELSNLIKEDKLEEVKSFLKKLE